MFYLEDDGRARSPSEHQDICAACVTLQDQFVANPLSRHKIFAKIPYPVVNHVIDCLPLGLPHYSRSFSLRHMRPLLNLDIRT